MPNTGISTTNGINTSVSPASDPYANVALPAFAGCDHNNMSVHNTVTLDPGVFCNGLQLNAGANVTLNPGVYYIDQGTFHVASGASVTGSGVDRSHKPVK